jgi:cytochrome c-type biogenesis protein CcmE
MNVYRGPASYVSLLIALCLSAVAFVSPASSTSGMLEVADLISHPDQYDKQMVVVVGRVTNIQTAANRQGQLAYGFLLKDSNGSVKVIGLGKSEVHEGDQVIVEGVFSRLRQVGRAIVYNEIKATLIRPIDRLNPDLVG